ncbi:hypothetical protein SAMN05660489_05831 [Pseudomonas sp. LAMO17WK12:I10]|uniref:type III secretion system inner rod subunit SctI n=1 Tax=unclassified Pseudomonas TaxID=196821 RepID=UPI000BDD728A|nr:MULTISPECIES: type III secretion system inner rod subunit SctI [unclassified Pseudomonas]PXX54001.1 hypothetical protein H160_05824 [Pseudomonas sp. LAMO17WK12:I9]SNY51934.1 hypothetical protein SAMN05660489_05831 [Pseudomonas sp. LAMO17WK12:I10]
MSTSVVGPSRLDQINVAELVRPEQGVVMSLEDRLIQGFASSSVDSERESAAIYAMLKRPDLTDPEVLSELQTRTAQYNIDVTLLNTLVRKAVTTAETLLRSS